MNSLPYILIAEDDADDRELIKEAFIRFSSSCKLIFYPDGEDLLISMKENKEKTNPKLIILDLNMPRKDGIETLRELKQNGDLSGVPIVIFSTSQSVDDKNNSIKFGANDFVTKPVTYEGLVDAVHYIMTTWLPEYATK